MCVSLKADHLTFGVLPTCASAESRVSPEEIEKAAKGLQEIIGT